MFSNNGFKHFSSITCKATCANKLEGGKLNAVGIQSQKTDNYRNIRQQPIN